jgi:hypothetical protein
MFKLICADREVPMFKKSLLFGCLVFLSGSWAFASCTLSGGSEGPGAPLRVHASIAPEPIVGREVVWHIEVSSSGPEFPNTKLQAALPEGVELVSGSPNWQGDIPAGGKVTVDLVIRVKMPGEWKLMARASASLSETTGYGIEKSLYVTSTTTSAEVVEDIHRPTAVIPTLQFAPTVTPESAPTTNPF